MAGITVSGGTYSGSGDLTTDWVRIEGSSVFIAPDGTLTLTLDTDDPSTGQRALYNAGTFTHNDGTVFVDVSTSAGTYAKLDARGSPYYNVIIKNDGSDTNRVQMDKCCCYYCK